MSLQNRSIYAESALTARGLEAQVRLEIDVHQRIRALQIGAARQPQDEHVGLLLPKIANLHSHAFQRDFAGDTELFTDPHDSFWTWREQMYAAASRASPDSLYAIALDLYQLMRARGYGWVCEFHYLHHQPDGMPYARVAALAEAIVCAARDAGLGLTLLPVLYQVGGFDGRGLGPQQRRFATTMREFFEIMSALKPLEGPSMTLGMALHSLRALSPGAMAAALNEFERSFDGSQRPIHLHIAEQLAEVEQCIAARGARPVDWLLDHAHVDARWCLVHATHMSAQELTRLAASGAVAGLCPTTEANLGDGLFPLKAFRECGGRIGIGSDSHASVDALEELRWLEYGQRLQSQRRNVYADAQDPNVALNLWRDAAIGGALASGQAAPLSVGAPAAFLSLAQSDPNAMSRLVFRHPHGLNLAG